MTPWLVTPVGYYGYPKAQYRTLPTYGTYACRNSKSLNCLTKNSKAGIAFCSVCSQQYFANEKGTKAQALVVCRNIADETMISNTKYSIGRLLGHERQWTSEVTERVSDHDTKNVDNRRDVSFWLSVIE